jgi:LysR family transcriptional regulator, glycine cleavage system transcriptional activator
MQDRLRHPPLNAVRAFVAAARLGSLKAAAADLGVTAGAVSRHVRQLEEEIGKPLFVRRNNGIELTRDGKRFYEQVAPALKAIARASEGVRKEAGVVSANVSTSLALHWLIPQLPEFRRRYPRISLEIETERRPVVLTETLDLAVSYARNGPPNPDARHLLSEQVVPMFSPALGLDRKAGARIDRVPLISSTLDDWEWRTWATEVGVAFTDLNVAYRFDTDAAAIDACAAGLGVMLVPGCMAGLWVKRGELQPFGAWPPQTTGDYWVSVAPRISPAARMFVAWLLAVAGASRPDNDNRLAGTPTPGRRAARAPGPRGERPAGQARG